MVVKSEEPAPRWRPFLAHSGDFSLKGHIACSRGIAPHPQLLSRKVKSTLLTQLKMYIPRQHYAPETLKSPHQHRSPLNPSAADPTALRTVIACVATICRSSVIDMGLEVRRRGLRTKMMWLSRSWARVNFGGCVSAAILASAPRLEMPAFHRKSLFRPCIDLHDGQVKQIVGGTLSDTDASTLRTNFVARRVHTTT